VYGILVTGAASGIGAGLAIELAARGHYLVVGDLDPSAVDPVVARIRAAGGAAQGVALDVTRDDSVATALANVSRPVDVLVNNAGLQHVAPLEEFPMQRWDTLIQVMLVGAARVTRAVLPGMRKRGFGRIVNIGSIHSLVASPYKSAYVAAKHGLVGLTRTLALETAEVDVTVNTICPSYVRTPLVDKQIADQARLRGMEPSRVIDEVMLAPMPKRVFIEIDELVGITEFLISRAARNVTGQTIAVDGGWTSQ
jgi:3-hydroxybutyrate dehydrogenase